MEVLQMAVTGKHSGYLSTEAELMVAPSGGLWVLISLVVLQSTTTGKILRQAAPRSHSTLPTGSFGFRPPRSLAQLFLSTKRTAVFVDSLPSLLHQLSDLHHSLVAEPIFLDSLLISSHKFSHNKLQVHLILSWHELFGGSESRQPVRSKAESVVEGKNNPWKKLKYLGTE